MEIIHLDESNLEEWQSRKRSNVIALGFFDGVHKGHQKVLRTARRIAEKEDAAFDVMSFFPHPKTVLSDGRISMDYLMPLEEKARALEAFGVDRFYIVKFTKAFASLFKEEYVETYLERLGTIHAVAGYDFSYGYRGEGTIDSIESDSGGRITASRVEKVAYQGEKISSTRIRSAILNGRLAEVEHLMGRKYRTCAEISRGYLSLKPYYMLPQDGVYDVIIDTGRRRHYSQIHVDSRAQKISFTRRCLMHEIDQNEIAITWDSRVATYSDYQLIAQ
jgi:riboflavin kinase/FMN adenylyltransferase